MELAFNSLRLRSWCENSEEALLSFKAVVVEHLQNRLADIRAAGSPMDLIAGSPNFTDGRVPRLTVLLADTHIMTCTVNHATPTRDTSGNIDWSRVRRLRIMSIEEVRG